MARFGYKSERFQVRVTDSDLIVINEMRGMIPTSTFLAEIVSRYVKEQEKQKQ
jgi:hypothetical protein